MQKLQKMQLKWKESKVSYLNAFLFVFFLGAILIYPLRKAHLGVDLWDGGYNYANFYYHGLEYMDSMWYYATWLANAVGNFFTRLPGGDTMLGMNVYTSLIIGMTATGAYVFCVRKLQIPMWMVFVGEILAISLCWLPSSALYNYLTYGFMLAGTLCLYQGLTTGQNKWLVLAGVALGLNVGNRFSNLVQMGLILAVWYYAFICKKKFSRVLQETGFCVLGYAGAFGLFLMFISIRYGFMDYVEGIQRLFAMTEYATDYSASSMLEGMVGAYFDSSYWVKRFAVAGTICLAICLLLPQKMVRVKQVLTGLIFLIFFKWLLKRGYCTQDFATYNSVYYPCIIIFEMAIALSLLQICSKKADKKEKLQAVLVLLLLTLTTLGGNNAIYSSINNLFFVLPCFFWMAYRFIKEREHILFFPFKAVLVASIVLLLIQGIRFGNVFVYEEATGARGQMAEVENVPILKGMYTEAAKAEELEWLYEVLQEQRVLNRECILYGDIPGIAYYMELAPAMNIWSDLRSYDVKVMREDLQKIQGALQMGEQTPIVIIDRKYTGYYDMGTEENLPEDEAARRKFIELCNFMDRQGYPHSPYAVSDNFEVYVNES